jgi:alpha-ketoglutarate-dependent taurine dioxygenase
VVFFRKQDDLDNELQKELAQRLGQLAGKPESSKLHVHPVSNSGRRLGGKDDEISVISSEQAKDIYKNRFLNFSAKKQSGKDGWHSDITFEPVPSDYALLRLTELPETGGGNLLLSYPVKSFIEANFCRYIVGLRVRVVRPSVETVPKVFRRPHSYIFATRIWCSRKGKWI